MFPINMKKACSVCLINCLRLHGAQEEDEDAKACSVCLINCLRLHGAQEEDEDANNYLRCALRKPKEAENVANVQVHRHASFLAKITESTMSTLNLPLSFVANNTERLGESIILEGPGKERWRVELHRSFRSFSISFGQGWEQFVADHVLQIGDQLCFSLSEKSYFQVEVYDEFGVRKRRALDATNTSLDPTNTSLDQENIKKFELKDLHSVDVAPIARQEEHDKPEKATQSAERIPIGLIQSSESESRIVSAPGNDMEIAEPAGSEYSGRPATEWAEIDKGGQLLPPQTLVGGKVVSQRRPVTELEIERALRGVHALKLVNPNISLVMTKGHVYNSFFLAIPKLFAKNWLPSENKEITLLNKSGHKWPAKWLSSPGGLSAGWRRFSLDHRLEEHDVCVLELVDKVDHTLVVHIFRVLGGPEEDPGLYSSAKLQSYGGKRNTKKSSPAVSNGHKAHCTPGKGQESISKPNKRTWESSSGAKNLKRKLCLQDDEASGSLAEARRLGNGEDHQNVEKLVNLASVDERARDVPGNKVELNSALEPRSSCRAESNPAVTPQVLRASRTDLVKLGKNVLTRKGLGDIDPPGAQAASAVEVHQQISNFADVSMPAGGRRNPPSIELAHEGRKKDQGQLYRVVDIHKGRSVGTNTDYLAEIEGYTEGSSATTFDRDGGTGFWWIPSDLFEWDMLSVRIR